MKITYNWLKDFVDIKIKPQALADGLTMVGLEVTSLEKFGPDTVFEIEVTPNRVDCLSVIGIAREVAAITGKRLRPLQATRSRPHAKDIKSLKLEACSLRPFLVKIEDQKSCPYYTARLIKDVKVGPSPDWLRKRLEAVGLRPINNIVDITNYCLMETGQPLHAFDYDKLISQSKNVEVAIRRARKGETIVTIDGENRTLDKSVLVIACGSRQKANRQIGKLANRQIDTPVAIAGIMGGLDTEVTDATKNILLESAYFDPVITRRNSRLLGIASESSYRFERGLDPAGVISSSDRALVLINKLCAGNLVSQKVAGKPPLIKRRNLIFNTTWANKFLGTRIQAHQTKRILEGLGFKLSSQSKHNFRVQVPSFRRDVQTSIDLAEELARLFGYDRISLSLPYIRVSRLSSIETPVRGLPATSDLLRVLQTLIKQILTSLGLNEIISYSLFSQDRLSKLNYSLNQAVKIKNPLTKDHRIMRPTLINGLLQCLAKNLSYRIDTIKVFEYNKAYVPDVSGDCPGEQINLGILITGQTQNSWLRKSTKLTLFDLKGLIETLCLRLGILEGNISFEPKDYVHLARGKSAAINIGAKDTIGFMGQADAKILSGYDIDNKQVFLAEIQVEELAKHINLDKKYKPPSVYPSIKRDLSVFVPSALAQEEIVQIIKQEAKDFISSIRVSEQYLGAQIPPGFRGLSFQLEYQSPTRTLRDEEIDSIQKKIIARLKEKLSIQIR